MDGFLAELLKRTRAFKVFDKDIDNSFCHAYLIVSPDVLASDNLLTLICARVYCKELCFNCPDCVKIFNNNKPDVKFLNLNGENLSVDQVSELIEDSYLSAVEGGKKLYVIKNFNKQSPAVQNKLLKTLEEPPENVHILLSATGVGGILPTVLSRVKKVSLFAFTTADISDWLKRLGVADADELARSAGGSLTLADKLANDAGFVNDAYELLTVFNDVKGSMTIPNHIKSRVFDNLAWALDISELIFQDALYVKSELNDNITFNHFIDGYNILTNSLTITGISNIMDEIIVCKQKLNAYVQNINIIDCLLLKLAEEKSKCKK